jgi:hypothetical protein
MSNCQNEEILDPPKVVNVTVCKSLADKFFKAGELFDIDLSSTNFDWKPLFTDKVCDRYNLRFYFKSKDRFISFVTNASGNFSIE